MATAAPAASVADPLIGTIVADSYRVLRSLGDGGVGRVYLVQHVTLGREMAMKVLQPALADNAAVADTFLDEARTVSRLGHENIIDIVYGGRTADGLAFIVMERLQGVDLADALAVGGPMSWERARRILLQITSALAAVHARGLVHGDIKPANIFLCQRADRRDFVKVLDFGLSRAVRGHSDPRSTEERPIGVLGTPDYMAPEQALARPVDGRTDVYAVGCLMYRMLTGSAPFSAPSAIELLAKQAYEEPVPPTVRRPDLEIPSAVESIVLRAMSKAPDDRFASVEQMGEALARCRFSPPDVPVVQFRMDDPAIARRARRSRRRRWITLSLLAVAAAGVAAFLA